MRVPPEFDLPLAPLGKPENNLRRQALCFIYRRAVQLRNAPWIEEEWTNRATREREVRRLMSQGVSDETDRLYSWDPPADLENATIEEGRALEEQAWNAHQEATRFLAYSFFRVKGDAHEGASERVRQVLGPVDWDCPVASAQDVQMFAAFWQAESPASAPPPS